MKIILDGKKMKTKEKLHSYLKSSFDLSDFYGENLDALWDELTNINDNLDIVLINTEKMLKVLGDYGKMLIELFTDLSSECQNINFYTDMNINVE